MLFLKLDNWIKFSWQVVLWPLWVLLALNISFFIFAVILAGYCIYCVIRGRYSVQIIIASIWQCWVVFGFGACAGFLMFDLILRLDYKYLPKEEQTNYEEKTTRIKVTWPFYLSSITFIAYFFINFITTGCLFKLLVNWYDQIFYSDDTVLNIFLTSEE